MRYTAMPRRCSSSQIAPWRRHSRSGVADEEPSFQAPASEFAPRASFSSPDPWNLPDSGSARGSVVFLLAMASLIPHAVKIAPTKPRLRRRGADASMLWVHSKPRAAPSYRLRANCRADGTIQALERAASNRTVLACAPLLCLLRTTDIARWSCARSHPVFGDTMPA